MNDINALGIGPTRRLLSRQPGTEYVMLQCPLQRVLAFRRRSIDDVVNSPIVKNEVLGYWKVFKQINRHSEILDLERQWNHLGHRV